MDRVADLLFRLENRLGEASVRTPLRRPWVAAERAEVVRLAKQCLGIRDEWIPSVRVEVAGEDRPGEVVVQRLRSLSWEGCAGAAHLFLPKSSRANPPLVVLCCGHGKGGKQALGYQRMAWRLAHMGCAVLVPDNIGQGERVAMGHANAVVPFQCGLSVQGLIVLETAGWVDWALADGRFDPARIAAVGNSGGGTLTLFLGAVCRDKLVALSSSGYPSSFAFLAAKEKKHCHCNLLPGVIGNLEMWQLYGCFAPKPLFLFQGKLDCLFPEDLFHRAARKVEEVYHRLDAASACRAEVFPGEHSWDDGRREALAGFLGGVLGLDAERRPAAALAEPFGDCFAVWPTGSHTADSLAVQLSGLRPEPCRELFRVYAPHLADWPDPALRRVGFRQLAAQWEAFLAPPLRLGVQPSAGPPFSRRGV